jgi:hypothetical protein
VRRSPAGAWRSASSCRWIPPRDRASDRRRAAGIPAGPRHGALALKVGRPECRTSDGRHRSREQLAEPPTPGAGQRREDPRRGRFRLVGLPPQPFEARPGPLCGRHDARPAALRLPHGDPAALQIEVLPLQGRPSALAASRFERQGHVDADPRGGVRSCTRASASTAT